MKKKHTKSDATVVEVFSHMKPFILRTLCKDMNFLRTDLDSTLSIDEKDYEHAWQFWSKTTTIYKEPTIGDYMMCI